MIRLSIAIRLRSNDTSEDVFASVFRFEAFIINNATFIDKNIRLMFSKPTPADIRMFAVIEVRNKLNTNDKLIFPANGILSEVLRILSMVYPGRKLQTRMEGMSRNHDHRGILPQSAASVVCRGPISNIDIDRR